MDGAMILDRKEDFSNNILCRKIIRFARFKLAFKSQVFESLA